MGYNPVDGVKTGRFGACFEASLRIADAKEYQKTRSLSSPRYDDQTLDLKNLPERPVVVKVMVRIYTV